MSNIRAEWEMDGEAWGFHHLNGMRDAVSRRNADALGKYQSGELLCIGFEGESVRPVDLRGPITPERSAPPGKMRLTARFERVADLTPALLLHVESLYPLVGMEGIIPADAVWREGDEADEPFIREPG